MPDSHEDKLRSLCVGDKYLDPITPLSDDQLNAKLAQWGVKLRPEAGKGPWPKGWWPGDEPLQIQLDEDEEDSAARGDSVDGPDYNCVTPAPDTFPSDHSHPGKGFSSAHPLAKFDVHARVRFLDALASSGNARAAAARVGVSRETVYRARRRYADFAQVWGAAMIHARARAEAELSTRALDGVAVPVFVRGQHVATWHRHDTRYLLAHLARLDRHVADNPDAAARAECFDQLLAQMAGHDPLDDVPVGATMPPTREAYAVDARGKALEAVEDAWEDTRKNDSDDEEDYEDEELSEAEDDALELEETAAMDAASVRAHRDWDRWNAATGEFLDRVLDGEICATDDGAEDGDGDAPPQQCVTCVNTPAEPAASKRRKVPAETMCSPLALMAGSIPETPRTAPCPPPSCGSTPPHSPESYRPASPSPRKS